MPHSLDTLLSLALHPELLLEVADSGIVPRLLTIATHRTEGCAAVALQLVQEICTLPAGRVNVARDDGARVLARIVQGEQPAALADPALHGKMRGACCVCWLGGSRMCAPCLRTLLVLKLVGGTLHINGRVHVLECVLSES